MSTYIRLTDYKDSDSKEQGFFKSENRFEAKLFHMTPPRHCLYFTNNCKEKDVKSVTNQ